MRGPLAWLALTFTLLASPPLRAQERIYLANDDHTDYNWSASETQYRQALRARANAETHNGLGYVLAKEGRPDEAVAEFRKAIDADPKFAPAYSNLADALAQQRRFEEAAETYQRLLAVKPSAAAYGALGDVLGQMGKTDEAAQQFAKAKALESAH